jgi:hypothetical protein
MLIASVKIVRIIPFEFATWMQLVLQNKINLLRLSNNFLQRKSVKNFLNPLTPEVFALNNYLLSNWFAQKASTL